MLTLALLTVLVPPGASAQVAPAPAGTAEVVSRYGLRPVEPAVPALELDLPRLGGGKLALSELAGRWVVLTFWATWCGPCRSEMPSLERLHLNRDGAGVSVLGISVDRTASMAERFVDEYSLTFTNLWDHRGRAADAYRARSIPLTYLIEPGGYVVAMSVGARDWLALQPMIDELIELIPPSEGGEAAYQTASTPLELPRNFEPPTAEASVVSPRLEAGEPFALEVRVHWAGHIEDYLLHPPRVLLPETVEQAGVTASTRSSDGRNVVTYEIGLLAAEAGSYALDPIELIYTPRGEGEPVSSRVPGPTVSVSEATVLGLPASIWLLAGGGALALAVGGGALLARGRKRRTLATESEGDEYARARARLDAARKRRMEGELRGAILELARLDMDLNGSDESFDLAANERLIEDARYGGYTPSREELDAIERKVARSVRELEEDPRQAAREALRLRNQES